jgi:alkanesulfonate monooxygenase SsuD/methylene tetrahydromethanopterin reductase-like flavin-dependent oxidoreductase (luciferase family)
LIQIAIAAEENRERFNEALDMLDAWLDQPVITHHGRYWKFDNMRIVPKPLQQPSQEVIAISAGLKSAEMADQLRHRATCIQPAWDLVFRTITQR